MMTPAQMMTARMMPTPAEKQAAILAASTTAREQFMAQVQTRVAAFLSHNPREVHIAENGVWSARCDGDGSPYIFSYEKLDYHAGAREFLEAVRDAGIPFIYHGSITL